ncbi:helix-turn-helix domain-containing protein [Lysinibacillus fusiformis]|uniref:helix-turn-helix domain-containing protein n=1 Tax=Lysinibacillus fusiformis TaxID=28031 RepID=UPI003D075B5A
MIGRSDVDDLAIIMNIEKLRMTMANLSIVKNGKAKAVRFSTFRSKLDCQRGVSWRKKETKIQ